MMEFKWKRRWRRWHRACLAGAGGALVVALLAATRHTGWLLLLGSFGSSAVIIFGYPDSGFSRAGTVVGAHMLCTAVGLACLHCCGDQAWAMGLSVGLSIALMLGLKLVHPPAGSDPLLVYALNPDWGFLLWPVLLGSLALVGLAAVWRRFFSLKAD